MFKILLWLFSFVLSLLGPFKYLLIFILIGYLASFLVVPFKVMVNMGKAFRRLPRWAKRTVLGWKHIGKTSYRGYRYAKDKYNRYSAYRRELAHSRLSEDLNSQVSEITGTGIEEEFTNDSSEVSLPHTSEVFRRL